MPASQDSSEEQMETSQSKEAPVEEISLGGEGRGNKEGKSSGCVEPATPGPQQLHNSVSKCLQGHMLSGDPQISRRFYHRG